MLYDNVLTKFKGCILQDDENYVKMDFKQIFGPNFYVATFCGRVNPKLKYIQVEKFGKKVMIWQEICYCGGKSEALGTKSTMNSNLYIQECLQKRILPMIRSHQVPVMFWPDFASCHYSRATMNWFEVNRVGVMPKTMNPPKCLAFRPSEKFCAIIEKKLMKNGEPVKDINKMRQKWNKFAGEVTEELVQ